MFWTCRESLVFNFYLPIPIMTVVKVIEVIGESEKSWDDATQEAIKKASESVRNITGIDVLSFKAKVENNKIVQYRAHAKVAFVVD